MGLIKTLRETEPFSQLPDEIFVAFNQAAILREYPPHTLIFKQQDPPTGYLYLVKEGLVEIVVLTPGGVEMVVDYRQAGAFFGGTPVFTNQPYTAGARTVQATACYLIPQALLTETAKAYPHISEHFTKTILSRVRSLYSELIEDDSKRRLTQIEAYPFKKRLSEIMTTPVETCPPSTCVREVALRMTEKRVGAILVRQEGEPVTGIITKQDLVSKVLARAQVACDSVTAGEIMTAAPLTLPADAFMFEATAFMMSHRIKHLPVLDQGEIVGMVSMRDLMRFRSQKAMLLVGQVKQAKTLAELAEARGKMVVIAKALQGETRSHFETMEILSYIHHCLQRRCFELVMEEMKQEGLSPPEIRFCLIIMGSGGRKEMLLEPDQDNGLIFENYPDSQTAEVETFFAPFSERLVQALARIGYPLCHGKVMVNNPLWRGRLQEWQTRIGQWISAPQPIRVMYSTIFLDFMPLVGDPVLCQELRQSLHREVRRNPIFLYYLLRNDLNLRSPLGLLGRFVVEKGGVDKGKLSLKEAGSIFIVDCVRIFLLEAGIDATTTVERLEQLVKLNVFDQETADHLKAALEAFTFLRLRHEIALVEQGQSASPYIDPYALSKNEQDLLREAFRVAAKLQNATKRHFNVG
ncbi:MAG: cyclic nucleotide-binding/CBS domain-containing protein [Desulfuromonadales bacterium]|nr:cyclic nucleotide-binding/CBS domain-containing protein [Desulfuromonadales bacterium]